MASATLAVLALVDCDVFAAGFHTCGTDNHRAAWNYDEPALDRQSVVSSRFARLWAVDFDGSTYASPLYLERVNVAGHDRDVIIGVSTRNSIYAIDAASGKVLWSHLALEASAEEEGAYSAPVFDPATGLLYLLTRTVRSDVAHFKLWMFEAASGAMQGAAISIDHETVPGFPRAEVSSRGGLLLQGGKIYAAFGGGKAEVSSQLYHGTVVEVDVSRKRARRLTAFQTTQEMRGGGIWGDCGVAADSRGQLWIASSNCNGDISDYSINGRPNYCQSLLSVRVPFDGVITPTAAFTPPNIRWLDNTDQGFCTSPVLVESHARVLAAAGNKDGYFYLVNGDDATRTMFRIQGTRHFLCGQMAVFASQGRAYFYSMGPSGDANEELAGVVSIRINIDGQSIAEVDPVVAWRAARMSALTVNGLYGSSHGSEEPVVWTVLVEGAQRQGRLAAFDALDGTRLSLGGDSAGAAMDVPSARRYRAPTVANSRVFVPAHGIVAFGLRDR